MHKIIFLFFLQIIFIQYHLCLKKTEFNPQKAIDFWHYQCASYCSQAQISRWNVSLVSERYPNLTDIEIIYQADGNNQAYIAFDSKKNIGFVSFRGTTNYENWMQDFRISKTSFDNCDQCEVHTGMLLAYNALKDRVIVSMLNLKKKYPNAEFAIIGHSLGAAFATLAFLDLYKVLQPDYFYTFGLPRMGNKQFADYVDGNFEDILKARITHYKDLVPREPLSIMGFYHFKTEIYYAEDSKSYVFCKESEDAKCINQFSLVNFSVDDHRNMFGLNVHEYKYTCQ